MTTCFVPCGAKLPIIAMFAGAFFGGSGTIAFSAYVLGVLSIIISGIMLKKFKIFTGDPAPFVMELPSYHVPTAGNVFRSMWERGSSFIKKQAPLSCCPPSLCGSPSATAGKAARSARYPISTTPSCAHRLCDRSDLHAAGLR